MDLNLPDVIRYTVVAAFAVLVLCAVFLRASYAEAVPTVLNAAAGVYGVVFAAVPTALILNDVLAAPLTPGAWLLFWVSVPAALIMLALTGWAARDGLRHHRNTRTT